MPVDWDEVADASLSPRQFKLKDIGQRLADSDPWATMNDSAKPLPSV
jgi:DNA primase